ncbi:MAG: AmmeMemoRadiSam system protein A [Syntrophomonadaceae bacterium]|nr:AmmeMemoRadiSam system protein A [Syntrophomonadaceae bacterium]
MITYTALSPHPPLLIPEIGGARLGDVSKTQQGLEEMARQMVDSCPETIVFLTPHGNIFSDALSALGDKELEGDFANFGCNIASSAHNDLELLQEIETRTKMASLNFLVLDEKLARSNRLQHRLDHGILVPLYYLQKAGLPKVSILAISIGYLPLMDLYAFGGLIRDAADTLGRNIAIVASGDMSHFLKDEGPYQYHPDGARYDARVKELLANGDVVSFVNMPEELRNNAGECGFRSLVIMLGALDGREFTAQVFSYEGPFGVGYLNMGFVPGQERDSLLHDIRMDKLKEIEAKRQAESLPVSWARMTLESYIEKGEVPSAPPGMEELQQRKAGAFVSLKRNGQLRGCIGTIAPAYGNLLAEIQHNAIAAATEDPRFSIIEPSELPELVYSVDVLGEPEPALRSELDPKRYGVIVTSGRRRGLLLPDLEGVDTVEEQLLIALQKAGISPNENYKIERFEVTRYK